MEDGSEDLVAAVVILYTALTEYYLFITNHAKNKSGRERGLRAIMGRVNCQG
jgi:hypothetical protein